MLMIKIKSVVEFAHYVPEDTYEVAWSEDEYDEFERFEAINYVHLFIYFGVINTQINFLIILLHLLNLFL